MYSHVLQEHFYPVSFVAQVLVFDWTDKSNKQDKEQLSGNVLLLALALNSCDALHWASLAAMQPNVSHDSVAKMNEDEQKMNNVSDVLNLLLVHLQGSF